MSEFLPVVIKGSVCAALVLVVWRRPEVPVRPVVPASRFVAPVSAATDRAPRRGSVLDLLV